MKERQFPTGHITRSISFRKIKDIMKKELYVKVEKNGKSQLLLDEAKLLNKLGIETRIWIRNLTLTQSGYYGISTDLFINKKEGVIRFYKEIGFSLSRKQNKLENYLKEVNWIDGFETVQHINSEKRIVQTN